MKPHKVFITRELITSAALCFAWAPAFAGNVPEWVTSGKHAKYSSQTYVSGVGTGASQSDAESNALSSIGKQILSNVKTSTQSSLSAAGESVSSFFDQNVEVESNEQIQGAKFVEKFNNTTENTWSVLAVLKIDDFIALRKKQAEDCLQKAVKVTPASGEAWASAAGTFKVAATLRVKALECGKLVDQFQAAKSLSPAIKGMLADDESFKKLESKFQADLTEASNRLSKLSFSATCAPKIRLTRKAAEPESHICDEIEKVIVAFGLAKGGENSPLELRVKYSAEEKGDGTSALVFLRSTFSVELAEKSKGTAFYKHSTTAEGAGSTPSAATAKVDQKAIETFTASFLDNFKK